jgi:hypothetical protein
MKKIRVAVIGIGLLFTLMLALTNTGKGVIYTPMNHNGYFNQDYEKCHLVKVQLINGTYVPVVFLPVIEISAEKTTEGIETTTPDAS